MKDERRLTRRFCRRAPVILARALLGQLVVRRLDDGGRLAGRIVEVEAYLDIPDRAAHTYGGRRTPRNESMLGEAGNAHVYFAYGMHFCMNVVAEGPEAPSACRLRALELLEGLGTMRRHRAARNRSRELRDSELCSGPARLTEALGIDRSLDGVDLTTSANLYLLRGARIPPQRVAVSPRIGAAYARGVGGKAVAVLRAGPSPRQPVPPVRRSLSVAVEVSGDEPVGSRNRGAMGSSRLLLVLRAPRGSSERQNEEGGERPGDDPASTTLTSSHSKPL